MQPGKQPTKLPPKGAARRAFTMIEMIVVVVLLALSAGLVLPRIVGGEDRKVRAGAERVAELLGALARRDAMLSQPMVLLLDAPRDRLYGEVFARTQGTGMGTLAGEARAEWREDRLLPDAPLDGLRLVGVQADGAELDTANLRVEFDQFSPRPGLRVVLSDAKQTHFWSVDLPASALQAELVAGDIRQARAAGRDGGGVQTSQDLDDAGLSESAW